MLHCTPVFFFWRGRGIQQKCKSSTIVLRKIEIVSQVTDTQSWIRSFLNRLVLGKEKRCITTVEKNPEISRYKSDFTIEDYIRENMR